MFLGISYNHDIRVDETKKENSILNKTRNTHTRRILELLHIQTFYKKPFNFINSFYCNHNIHLLQKYSPAFVIFAPYKTRNCSIATNKWKYI